jgi:NADH-quinone oxidoreductase subunit N
MLLIPLSLQIYLSVSVLYCLIAAVVAGKISKLNYSFSALEFTVRSSALCLLLSIFIAYNGFISLGRFASYAMDQGLVFDGLAFLAFAFLATFVIALLFYYGDYAQATKISDFEIPILMVYSFISMVILLTCSDFIIAYLAVELQSLVFYILAASNRFSPFSTEAGLKYFVLGAFASGLMLFGTAIVYFSIGTVDFYAAHFLLANDSLRPIFYLGLAFFISALMFKLSAFPFHSWTPDVYAGSPLAITAFFSILPKLAVLAFVGRFYLSVIFSSLEDWNFLFLLVGLATLFVGAFGALYQSTFRRLLAYSTISHVGFIMLGFSAGLPSGMASSILYVLVYSLTNLGIFGILLSMHYRFLNEDDHSLNDIHELRAIFTSFPTLSFLLGLFLLSLAGIPPLAGFFAKYSILTSLIEAKLYSAAVLVVLLAFVSAYYYLRLIKLTFFVRPFLWNHFSLSSKFAYALGFLIAINVAFVALFELTSTLILLLAC